MNNAWRMNEGENKNWNTKGWAGDNTMSPPKNTKGDVRQNLDRRQEERKLNTRG